MRMRGFSQLWRMRGGDLGSILGSSGRPIEDGRILEGRSTLRSMGGAIYLMEKLNKQFSPLKIRIGIPESHEFGMPFP